MSLSSHYESINKKKLRLQFYFPILKAFLCSNLLCHLIMTNYVPVYELGTLTPKHLYISSIYIHLENKNRIFKGEFCLTKML